MDCAVTKCSRPGPDVAGSLRIFSTSRRWPLIPSADLRKLQASLSQYVQLADSPVAQELLDLVGRELQLRKLTDTGPRPAKNLSRLGRDSARRRGIQ